MRSLTYFAASLTVLAAVSGGSAVAANMCRTDHLQCATRMPVDGYCECTARGHTEDGTVVASSAPRQGNNARSGGCGVDPNNPGCR